VSTSSKTTNQEQPRLCRVGLFLRAYQEVHNELRAAVQRGQQVDIEITLRPRRPLSPICHSIARIASRSSNAGSIRITGFGTNFIVSSLRLGSLVASGEQLLASRLEVRALVDFCEANFCVAMKYCKSIAKAART
jgi:hypothetical protein